MTTYENTSLTASSPGAWSKLLPVHPAALIIPELGRDELIKLGQSIKDQKKMWFPVTVLVEDHSVVGNIGNKMVRLLDGISRLNAMALIGIPFTLVWHPDGVPIIVAPGYEIPAAKAIIKTPDFDPYKFTADVNMRRRHLTATQRREYVERILGLSLDLSHNAIATMAGVSHNTVAAAARKRASNCQIDNNKPRREESGRRARGRRPETVVVAPPPSPPPEPRTAVEMSAATYKAAAAAIEEQQLDNVLKHADFGADPSSEPPAPPESKTTPPAPAPNPKAAVTPVVMPNALQTLHDHRDTQPGLLEQWVHADLEEKKPCYAHESIEEILAGLTPHQRDELRDRVARVEASRKTVRDRELDKRLRKFLNDLNHPETANVRQAGIDFINYINEQGIDVALLETRVARADAPANRRSALVQRPIRLIVDNRPNPLV
jgi:hypothetical protein